jgi:hypothetical protein
VRDIGAEQLLQGAMMQDDRVFFIRPDDIVHDTIEGETVVIDLRSGVYYRLDGAAARAWNGLQDRATEDELVDRLHATYAAPRETIAGQVHAFLIALSRDGIICREAASADVPDRPADAAMAAGPGASETAHRAPREKFNGTALDRFDHLRPMVDGPTDGRLPFDGMTLNRFDDLEELLLIDPVHEVKDEGWPHRQKAD